MEPPPVPRFLELTPEQREKYFDENGVILRQLDLDPRKLHALLLLTEMVKKGHPSVRSRFTTVLDLTAEQSAAIAQATNRSVTSLALLHTGQNTVYEERWQADFPPRPIGTSFMVVPAARADERFEGRRTIALASDSESAPASFGTGLHATTQASMLLLERWLQPEHRVLDLGTGSGILAAAAGRLGGREILAIDPESEAVVVAERTVALNRLSDRIQVRRGDIESVGEAPFDLVVANLLGSILVSIAPPLCRAVAADGVLIVSGFRAARRELMREVFASEGLRPIDQESLNGWLGLAFRRET